VILSLVLSVRDAAEKSDILAMRKNLTVVIDGPAGSGKSTVSKRLAKELGYAYVDTGAMYRAVALRSAELGVDPADDGGLAAICEEITLEFRDERLFMDGRDVSLAIRTPAMDRLSSVVSARPSVRKAMIGLQRKTARGGGVVMEGRDIGTVVLPDADKKFFLTADPRVRGERRFKERLGKGETADLENVISDIEKRDKHDSERELSPLKPAPDAIIIDTTHLSLEEVIERICEKIV
jgi:cytidylate kinase